MDKNNGGKPVKLVFGKSENNTYGEKQPNVKIRIINKTQGKT